MNRPGQTPRKREENTFKLGPPPLGLDLTVRGTPACFKWDLWPVEVAVKTIRHLCTLIAYASSRIPRGYPRKIYFVGLSHLHVQQFVWTILKISPDKSNLWYTESKAKFTHTIKMVHTGTATASSDFARSMQTAVHVAEFPAC